MARGTCIFEYGGLTVISSPEQTKSMLMWFYDQGVSSLDIHLRCPKIEGAKYRSDHWVWLTSHENLSFVNAEKMVKWCRYKNYHGSDIFIRPHRHAKQPIIFLDDISVKKAMLVSKKYKSQIIETSHNNTQVWISLTKSLSETERKVLQQHISRLGYSDKGSVSGDHLGRLCGFKSQKRNCWVKLLGTSSSKRYDPPDLVDNPLPQGGACANRRNGEKSQSEIDFSWVLSRLRVGESIELLRSILIEQASIRGKPQPKNYAERTVRNAIRVLTQN
jgi:hypothetical protein